MPVSEPWLVIANPYSGSHKNRESTIESFFESFLSICPSAKLSITNKPKHASELAIEALQEGIRHFCIVGGDGTLSEALNGIFSQDKVAPEDCFVTVLPWGTGNDWAAYYQIPKTAKNWLASFQNNQILKQDIGKVTYTSEGHSKDHYFINFVGCGFDTYILDQMGSGGGKRYRYYQYLVKSLFSYEGNEMHIVSEECSIKHQGMMNMVCLGKYGGAGMIFAPLAKMDDGLFDVISLQDMGVFQRLCSLPYLMNGKVNEHKKVSAFQTNGLSMSSPDTMSFQCDGEVVGQLPVNIQLIKHAINVVIPMP